VILKIVISSSAQQIINAVLSVLKIRILFEILPAIAVGKFALYVSMFIAMQFLFDSSRKTILSRIELKDTNTSNVLVTQLIKRDLIIITVFACFIYVFYFFGPKSFLNLDFYCISSLLITICLFSVMNCVSTLYSLEYGFYKLSTLMGVSQLIAFPLFYLMSQTGNIPILIFVNFLGNILPGFIAFRRVKNDVWNKKPAENVYGEPNFNWLLGIQISETSANSLNSLMVTSQLGFSANAEYLLYSKFALLYDFIPIALTPLVIARSFKERTRKKVIPMIIFANAIFISLFALLSYKAIVKFLSAGQLDPSLPALASFLFGGFIISVTSLYIQSAVGNEILTYRFKVATFVTLINLASTWMLLPLVGISATYLMTGLSTALYSFLLYSRIKFIRS